ncbi:MAG: hypothetical protein HFG09_05735 [Oscillibacter sp.]|nr:hypothetical protein [Oscillibacter sp.]
MQAIEIARRMAELGQPDGALRAYVTAVREGGLAPEEELEAAACILRLGGDYKLSYTCFLNLYRQGHFREDILSLLTEAFYAPNLKQLQSRYERNVKLLNKYPYLFRKDFPAFEDLPLRFYPYDDDQYLPFDVKKGEFEEFTDLKHPVVSRYFFKDLEKPILADDVYSQYELEYLRDNVRPSEYVARENHIYLHYTSWETFCAYLQCLNLRPLLEEEKLVFLIGDEVSQYPIDFKERFGIDYSQYSIKPLGIREIRRMIWHAQLQSHNGVNYFSEILDSHPNALAMPALMYDETEKAITEVRDILEKAGSMAQAVQMLAMPARLSQELYLLKGRTDKDILVALVMGHKDYPATLDPAARITPALLFSPHFGNIKYHLRVDEKGRTVLYSDHYEKIRTSPIFRNFKYIKTFIPLRRPTISHGAAVKFILHMEQEHFEETGKHGLMTDELVTRVVNRSYLIDWQDRLYKDSVLVRFEDGKLNRKATFTALAEFLDLPYAESMEYCSTLGVRDPQSSVGGVRGFDNSAVYRTYDDYVNDAERYFIEYCLRDLYEAYGYDFQCYDGQTLDEAKVEELLDRLTVIDGHIRKTAERLNFDITPVEELLPEGASFSVSENLEKTFSDYWLKEIRDKRKKILTTLLQGLHFINLRGQFLRMAPMLKLDPALLEQPLYH